MFKMIICEYTICDWNYVMNRENNVYNLTV